MRPTASRAGRRRQSGTPTPCFCCCPPTSVLSSPSSSNPSTVLPTRARVRQACQTDSVLLVREVKSSRMCVGRCFFVQILRRRSGRPDPLRDHVVHCYNSWPPGCKTFSVLSEDTGLSSKSQTRRPIVAIIVSYALIGRRLCLGGASSSASTPSGSLTASRRPPATVPGDPRPVPPPTAAPAVLTTSATPPLHPRHVHIDFTSRATVEVTVKRNDCRYVPSRLSCIPGLRLGLGLGQI